MNKTYILKKTKKSKWYIVNAEDKHLGRLSTRIAMILRGKNQPTYTPYLLNPSYVIITNAEKICVTGQKRKQKFYFKHSGRPGGLKKENFETLQKRIPHRIIEKSIKGMLPKGALGRELFTRLKVYSGENHPHNAQNPEIISIT